MIRLFPLYVILTLVFFYPVFYGYLPGPFLWVRHWLPWASVGIEGKGNFILSDQIDQLFPLLNYLKTEGFPVYSKDFGVGMPMRYLTPIGHLYPLSAISLLAVPIEYYWIICALLKFFWIGYFTTKLLELYEVEPRAALLFGVLFAFSLYSVIWAGATLSYSLSAIPMLLYALTSYLKTGKGRIFLFVSFCFSLLSPFPTLIVYTAIVAVPYLFVLKVTKTRFYELLLIAFLALLACSYPLYVTADYLSSLDLSYRVKFSGYNLDAFKALLLAFPTALGSHSEMSNSGLGHFNEQSGYVGSLVLILSIANWFQVKSKLIWYWMGVQFWALSMIYNLFWINDLFSHLPLFKTNLSTRLFSLYALSTIMLASLALNKIRVSSLIFSSAVLVGGLLVCFGKEVVNWNGVYIELGFLFVGLVLVSQIRRKECFSILFVVCFVQSMYYGSNYNGYYPPSKMFPETETLSFLKENLKEDERIITIGKVLIPHSALFYGIPTLQTRWFVNEKVKKYVQQIDPTFREKHPTAHFFAPFDPVEKDQFLDELNIKYLIIDRRLAASPFYNSNEYEIIFRGKDRLCVVENKNIDQEKARERLKQLREPNTEV